MSQGEDAPACSLNQLNEESLNETALTGLHVNFDDSRTDPTASMSMIHVCSELREYPHVHPSLGISRMSLATRLSHACREMNDIASISSCGDLFV